MNTETATEQAEAIPDQMVLDYHGNEHPASKCVTLIGDRYAHEDDENLVDLHDGRFALLTDPDVREMHDGQYVLLTDPDVRELHDGSFALEHEVIQLGNDEYALAETAIKDVNDEYILIAEAVPVLHADQWSAFRDGTLADARRTISLGVQPQGCWEVYHQDDTGDCYEVYSLNARGTMMAHSDYVIHTEDEGPMLCEDTIGVEDEYYSRCNSDVRVDVHGNGFLLSNDAHRYVESEGEYYPEDEVHWCSADDEWHVGEDEDECSQCCSEERVNNWHRTPPATLHRGTSGWLAGYEVEKNNVCGSQCGDYVRPTKLFAGWEYDGSCGVEGITNAYDPLDPAIVAKFTADLQAAKDQVDSPANRDCGGHINISCGHLSGRDILKRFRTSAAPLFFGLWRFRLSNSYCHENKRLTQDTSAPKYSVARVRDNGVMEVRLPNAVRDAANLLRRHRLVGAACAAMERNDQSFVPMYRDAKPLLLEMYGGHRKRLAKAIRCAHSFEKWLKYGHASPNIRQWVSPYGSIPQSRVSRSVAVSDGTQPITVGAFVSVTPPDCPTLPAGCAFVGSGPLPVPPDWSRDNDIRLGRRHETTYDSGYNTGNSRESYYAITAGSPAHVMWAANRDGWLRGVLSDLHVTEVIRAMETRYDHMPTRVDSMTTMLQRWLDESVGLPDHVRAVFTSVLNSNPDWDQLKLLLSYVATINSNL